MAMSEFGNKDLAKTAQNDWRDVGQHQVAMHS